MRRALTHGLLGLLVGLLAAPPAWAAPQGPNVVSGKVKIKTKGHKTKIKASRNAIIDWDSFDVGAAETVVFKLKGKRARVLNNVVGGAASLIDGTIRSNGQVYLLNANGLHFGKGARVEAARFVGGAAHLRREDFLAGLDRFTDVRGEVVNAGDIEAGDVVLVGRRVANHGRILATDGGLLIAAGDELWLADHDSPIVIQLAGFADAAGLGAEPAVENTGRLEARHGRVRLAAGDDVALAIRQRGEIVAERIELDGGRDGLVDVAGTLDASRRGENAVGGSIDVRGDWIWVDDAVVDASGTKGGGDVRIGGDTGGGGDGKTARGLHVGEDATVRADALAKGDGGSIVLWSDESTRSRGELSARGGAGGGDGGFIETSGKLGLELPRAPDVSAAAGDAGQWLIDPINITVTQFPPEGVLDGAADSPSFPDALNPDRAFVLFQSDGEPLPATVSNQAIVDALVQGAVVTVTTERFLGGGEEVGDIRIEAPILIPGGQSAGTTTALQFFAADDILVLDDIAVDGSVDDFQMSISLLANDNVLMANMARSVGQEELDADGDGIQDADQFERGDLTIAPGVRIDTGGGQLLLQGVTVVVGDILNPIVAIDPGDPAQSALVTRGGGFDLIAANPISGTDQARPVNGDAVLAVPIDSRGSLTDGGVRIRARGGLATLSEIDAGESGIILSGETMTVNEALRGGAPTSDLGLIGVGVQLGRNDESQDTILGSIDLPATTQLGLNASADSTGPASVVVTGSDVALGGAIRTGEGNIVIFGTDLDIEAGADLIAREGSIQIDQGRSIDVAAATLEAERLGLNSGISGPADENGTAVPADLTITGATLASEDIDLSAGGVGAPDGFDPALLPRVAIDDTTTFRGLDSDGDGGVDVPLASLSVAQDAALDGDDIADASQFTGGVAGLDYRLESREGGITLDSGFDASKVAGADLVLAGSDVPVVDTTIAPRSLLLRTNAGLAVDATLAANLRPELELEIHAGADGTDDLTFDTSGGAPVLQGTEITLRAGSSSATSPVSRVDVTGVELEGTPALPLSVFTLRQDADLADADVPTVDQFQNDTVSGLDYRLRSDQGSVTLSTGAKVLDTDLRIAAQSAIDLPETAPLQVRSADLGGVGTFTVDQQLLDGVSASTGRITLRAALNGSGTLLFDAVNPVTVRADALELVAVGDEESTAATGRVRAGIVTTAADAPTFTSVADPAAPPAAFVVHQTESISQADLPVASQFGGGELSPDYGVRVSASQGVIDFDDFDLVPTFGRLTLSADTVLFSKQTDTLEPESGASPDIDLDFTELFETDGMGGVTRDGTVLVEADTLSLEANVSLPVEDPANDRAAFVDASANLLVADYDDDTSDFARGREILGDPPLDPGATPGATGTPGSIVYFQEADFTGADLIPAANYASGSPDGAGITVRSRRGGITMDDPSRVAGSALTLDVSPLGTDFEAISDRDLVLDGIFALESLSATSVGGIDLPANLEVAATGGIVIQAGAEGEPGDDLILGTNTTLRGESIALLAGNGGAPPDSFDLDDPDEIPETGPSVRAGAATFQLVKTDADTLTTLVFSMDGEAVGRDRGTIEEVDGPGGGTSDGALDLVSVISFEAGVEIGELADLPGETLVFQAGIAPDPDVRATLLIEGISDLDLSPGTTAQGGTVRETVTLLGEEVVLRANAGEVDAGAGNIGVFGANGQGTIPERFSVTQEAAIVVDDPATPGVDESSAANLPDTTDFGRPIDDMEYRFESTGGTATFDSSLAAKVPGTALELIGRDVVQIITDGASPDDPVGLASLFVDSTQDEILLGGLDSGGSVVDTNLRVSGEQRYGAPVRLLSDARLRGGEFAFESTIDEQQTLEVVTSGPARFMDDVGGTVPLDDLILDFIAVGNDGGYAEFGTVGATAPQRVRVAGDLLVNPEGREILPLRSTFGGVDGTLEVAAGGDVIFGAGEKLVVNGDARIDSPGRVLLGDVAVLGRFEVNAAEIGIQTRSGNALQRADGALVSDDRVTLLAGDFALNAPIVVEGDGRLPLIGVVDPLSPPLFATGALGNPRFPVQALTPRRTSLTSNDFVLVLDGTPRLPGLRPEGPGTADLARTLADPPPAPIAPGAREATVRPAESLEALGVDARPPTVAEWRQKIAGAAIYDDSSPSHRVVAARLNAEAIEESLTLHRSLFGEAGENAPRLRETLGAAVDDYRRETRARRVIGFEFRRYVRNRPNSQFEAHQALDDLDRLFRRHRNSGLAPSEWRRVQNEWLDAILPSGIRRDELAEAIYPSRYVRGSDILDIFGE